MTTAPAAVAEHALPRVRTLRDAPDVPARGKAGTLPRGRTLRGAPDVPARGKGGERA
jgi:hypothetical protein